MISTLSTYELNLNLIILRNTVMVEMFHGQLGDLHRNEALWTFCAIKLIENTLSKEVVMVHHVLDLEMGGFLQIKHRFLM